MGYATEHETRPVRPSIIGSSSAKWWASLRCISPFPVADFLLSDDGHVSITTWSKYPYLSCKLDSSHHNPQFLTEQRSPIFIISLKQF